MPTQKGYDRVAKIFDFLRRGDMKRWVEVQPRRLSLEAGQQESVTVDITAPDGFSGRQAININAVDGEHLVGGVTLYVE